jgi:hypothetical protein
MVGKSSGSLSFCSYRLILQVRPGALVYVEKNELTNIQHFFGCVNDAEVTEADMMDQWDLRDED